MRSYYFPRKDFAQIILNNIQTTDSMNMMLFKERRSGKTSFLKKDIINESLTEKYKDKVFCFYHSFMGE